MLRPLGRFLIRFRWPVMAGLLVFVTLTFLLQPRPLAEYRVSAKRPGQSVYYDRFAISPSGRFVLLTDHLTWQMALVELATGRVVFDRHLKDLSECRFDADVGLVFVDHASKDHTTVCWRWLPGTNAPTKILERPSFLPGIHGGEGQHFSFYKGIARFEDSMTLNAFLSPDARTWLIPVRDQKSFHFELVDARTGQLLFHLAPPLAQPDMESKPVCEVAFSADSRQIVMQYPLPEENKREDSSSFVLEVHSAETGKRVRNDYLPFRTRLGQLAWFDGKQILAIDSQNDLPYLQVLSAKRDYQRLLMKETVAEPLERGVTDSSTTLGVSHATCALKSPITAIDGVLIYCWEHEDSPRFGGSSGTSHLPGFYFACRNLETGQLVHTERLPLRERSRQDYSPEDWQLLGVLPRHVLLLKEPAADAGLERGTGSNTPQWKKTLESWRERYASWLPSLMREVSHVVCIDAVTGKTIDRLTIPDYGQLTAAYIPQQGSLYIGMPVSDGETFAGFHILQYSYPLRKPWLVVMSWSLGIFAILALLQSLLWLRLRRNRKIDLKTTQNS